MAIGKISGLLLQDNLERQGANTAPRNLAIDGNLTYFDVNNRRVGINNSTPDYSLDSPGNARIASLTILGNVISSNTGKVGLGTISSVVINGGASSDVIYTDGTGNLSFTNIGSLPDFVAANSAISTLQTTLADFEMYANANATSQADLITTLGANVGAYQLYANANATTQSTQIDSINANVEAANLALANTKGNTIPLGSNVALAFVSNAVILTTDTTVTDAIAELNFVLGKLVPPSPPPFPGNVSSSLSINSLTTYGRMCDFVQTDNSGWGNLSVAGSTSLSILRTPTYSTSATPVLNVGPGNTGTVTAYINGIPNGNVTLTGTNSNTTDGNIYVYNVQDYHNFLSNVTAGFWTAFSTYATGTVAPGWNTVYINDSATNVRTNIKSWYYDASTPGAPTFSNTSISLLSNSVSYSSTVPHFNSSTTFKLKGNIAKLSGDQYYSSDTFITGAAAGGFAVPASITYANAGVTTPLAQNLYVASGSAYFETTASITTGFSTSATGPSLTAYNSYTNATSAFAPGVTVLYKTGTSNQIEETSLSINASVGSGSGNPYRIVLNVDADTPPYTSSEITWNSQTSTLHTYDATVIGAVLKHDQTNYSTGYLPVGPNLSSGRGGAQYFTFKFVRTAVSKFDIKYSGTCAGLWVALPGSTIDASSTLNGWIDMGTAYAGSGVPGANTGAGGNGSNGAALGGLAVFNSVQTNKSVTATFGTVSSSSTPTNEIYVRVKLTAGQSLTALTIEAATH